MEPKTPTILALSGHKGSGKNTLATFIAEYYFIQTNKQALQLALADGIKDFCIDILGLEHIQCYGSDEDKNTLTPYKWENTPVGSKEHTYMTAREVMQIFGTECVRTWFGNVWTKATIRKILKSKVKLAIITDNRFPNEAETILEQPKGYIIRLTRSPFDGDLHASETSLDDFDWNRPKCFLLDNAHLTIDEQNEAVLPILEEIFSWQ